MILYYINNYFSELEKKISKEKKNFFISPNQIDKFKFKKFKNFYYAEKYYNNKNLIKDYQKNINFWHDDLKKIDIIIQKIFSKKIELNLENYFISSYIFRYFSYQEYCKVLTIEKIIKSFIKKNKIKKIIFINKFQLNYFSEKFILQYFKNKFNKIDIKVINSFIEKMEGKRQIRFNKKNLKILLHLLKKKISNNLIGKFSKSKNLYLTYDKELIYSDEYNFFISNKIKLKNNLDFIYPQKNFLTLKSTNIKKIFLQNILNRSIDLTKKNLNQIFEIKKILINQRIKKIIYDIEDNSFLSFLIIFTAKNLNIPIIGYAHGSDYTTSNRDIDHNYLCYKFCDELRLWGKSRRFNTNKKNIFNKKIYFNNKGSLTGKFLSKIMCSKVQKENILYVPSLVRSDYTNAKHIQDPSWQFNLQIKILNFFAKNSSYRVFISYPNNSLLYNYNFFPCFFLNNFQKLNTIHGSFKDNFLKLKPKKIIFDNFSTGVYEALSSNSDILTFIDPLNQPKEDVFTELKKRVEVIKTFNNFDKNLEIFLKKKIKKKNNNFEKKFYFQNRT